MFVNKVLQGFIDEEIPRHFSLSLSLEVAVRKVRGEELLFCEHSLYTTCKNHGFGFSYTPSPTAVNPRQQNPLGGQ